MFEAFWQGRLIPGARIDSLPFIEVRHSCNQQSLFCIATHHLLTRPVQWKHSTAFDQMLSQLPSPQQ